jgi:hypothetical protein
MWSELQTKDLLPAQNLTQMVFALGGNDPTPALAKCPKAKVRGIQRKHAAVRLSAYPDFMKAVYTVCSFDRLVALNSKDIWPTDECSQQGVSAMEE